MSTVKISELPVLASADAADEFVVVDDSAGVTKKITQAGLADFGSNTLTAAGITLGASTLDDYEEGTWTLGINPTTSGSISFGTNNMRYTKIGRMVHIYGFASVSSVSSPVGNARISGLPFASLSNSNPGVCIVRNASDNANRYSLFMNGSLTEIVRLSGTSVDFNISNEFSGDELILVFTSYEIA